MNHAIHDAIVKATTPETPVRDFVGVYEGCIPPEVCGKIIEFYEKAARWRTSTYSGYEGVIESSERVRMVDYWIQPGEPYFDEVRDGLTRALDQYARAHPDFSVAKSNGFRLNRYPAGGFMGRHVDNIHRSHGQKTGYPVASCSLILNNDFEGGDFIFFDTLRIPPRPGQAIVFPSNFLFPHQVEAIRRGVRYSIVTWMV